MKMNNSHIMALSTGIGTLGGLSYGMADNDSTNNFDFVLHGAAIGGSVGLASAGLRYQQAVKDFDSTTRQFVAAAGLSFWKV